MTEDEKIEQWIKNPIVPEWMKKGIEEPTAPNTIHYDETLQKVIYTNIETGEEIVFDTLEEAHDSDLIERDNTEIISEIPGVDADMGFVNIKTDDEMYRVLFFRTKKQSNDMLMYQLYMAHRAAENFKNNSDDFSIAQYFIHSHLLNWKKSKYDYKDYDKEGTIKKQAIFNGDDHFWKVSTTLNNKTTMSEDYLEAEGKTVEEAIINLAHKINDTYEWTGEVKND